MSERAKKPRYMEPYTATWKRMANEIARSYAPQIHDCGACGGPVAKGYCCQRCGSRDPERRVSR